MNFEMATYKDSFILRSDRSEVMFQIKNKKVYLFQQFTTDGFSEFKSIIPNADYLLQIGALKEEFKKTIRELKLPFIKIWDEEIDYMFEGLS